MVHLPPRSDILGGRSFFHRDNEEGVIHLRKIILFLITAMLLLAASGTASAALPTNLGYVQDRAGYFTADQKTELKKQAVAGPLKFYILTIASLNGAAPADYATAVYQSWKLKTDDVLIVISDKEHRVEMNFDNPKLQAKIDALADDYDGDGVVGAKLDELVNRHFIPLAKKGDFAGAATALMKASDKLMPAAPAASAKPSPTPPKNSAPVTATAKPTQQPASAKPDSPSALASAFSSGLHWLGTILAIAVIAAIILLPVAALLRGLMLKRRLAAIRERFASRMVETNQLLEGFAPFTDLSDGKTEDIAKEWTKSLEDLLIRTQDTVRTMEGLRTFPLFYRKLKRLIAEYAGKFEAEACIVPEGQEHLKQLQEAERQSKPRVDALLAAAARARTVLQETSAKLDSPLEATARELAKLDELVRRADETDAFDPVAAMEWIGQAETAAAKLESDLRELSLYNEKLQGYPERAQNCRTQVKDIVERNFLHAIGFDPYAPLADSQERIERCRAALKQGNLVAVRDLWEDAEGLLNGAVATVSRLADLRQANQSRKDELEQRQRKLEEDRDELARRLQESRGQYASTLWEELVASFERDRDRLEEAGRILGVARQLTSDDRQQFEAAAGEMDRVHSLQDDIAAAWSRYGETIGQWPARRKAAADRVRAGADYYQQMLTWIETEKLICLQRPNVQAAMETIAQLQAAFEEAQAAPVCDLLELEHLALQHSEATKGFGEYIGELGQLKRSCEEEFDKLDRTFHSTYRQASSYLSRGATKNRYKTLEDEIKSRLDEGRYEEIPPQLQAIKELIHHMSSVYREGVRLDQERSLMAAQQEAFREQARAARQIRRASQFVPFRSSQSFRSAPHHHHRSGGGGGGGGSSSSHSSGGGSWGGGSSGGGSFGGGGKGGNSSGGANW